jgi:hypothetical protein
MPPQSSDEWSQYEVKPSAQTSAPEDWSKYEVKNQSDDIYVAPSDPPGSIARFLSAAAEPIKGAVKVFDPRPTDDERSRGLTSPYDYALRPIERAVQGQIEQGKQAFDPSLSAPERIGHGMAAALPLVGPWAANVGETLGKEAGAGDYAGAAGTVAGNAALALGPKAVGKVLPKVAKTINSYAPRQVEVGGEKVPVLVGEAAPESRPGRLQTNLKRSGAAAERFEKVEGKQQQAVKDVIRNTAQKTSGVIGPMQAEPSAVVNDAATAAYTQAAPLYDELDASLVEVPDALNNVSKITQDAIGRARKLGLDVGDDQVDLTKIRPDKDGTVQWGGTRISKATHPERWAKLVQDGIIDDSGGFTPLKAYRQIRSQLLKMQRSASDAQTRFAIGKDIDTMTGNIESALKGTAVEKNWAEANRLWSKGKALQDVSEAVRDATKGTPASAQAPGVAAIPTRLQGASLVSKLNDLAQDGTLEKAFSHDEIANLRQAADILDRIQRTPVGRGSGESMSMARGLTHAIRGNTGPLVGGGVGAVLGGWHGAEFGAGIGFVLQRIGEQGLVRVMTKVEGVRALKALENAKTPAAAKTAVSALVTLGAAGGQAKKGVARALQP